MRRGKGPVEEGFVDEFGGGKARGRLREGSLDQRLSHLWDIKEVCMGCLGFEWWLFAFLV